MTLSDPPGTACRLPLVFEKPSSFAAMENRRLGLGTNGEGKLCWFDRAGAVIRRCHDNELAYLYTRSVAHEPVAHGAMVIAVRIETSFAEIFV
ncbi:hypothetical protein K8R03_03855 [Candidatus Kaiserbacteria bacterium]|nr:hypothetical protein [Candidatus Kaiserbacteria bacterium]